MNVDALKESIASARSQPVVSLITIVMIAGMIFAVMLTTGRTVGAEQKVTSLLDERGTRSILIHAEPEVGLMTSALKRIENIDGIEWAGGFSAIVDARNARVPDGNPVPTRYAYSDNYEVLGISGSPLLDGTFGYASPQAADLLGLAQKHGGITLTTGEEVAVVGELGASGVIDEFTPVVLIPRPPEDAEISTLVIVAAAPELISSLSKVAMSVIGVDDPEKITLRTNETLAELSGLIQGQLASFSRGLVFGLIATMGLLLAVLLSGLVMLRRKDFGRRRALGATRSLIYFLLLAQTGFLAILGILSGTALSLFLLVLLEDPLPGASFITALGTLTFLTALIAATIPATFAARRQPIRELRVP